MKNKRLLAVLSLLLIGSVQLAQGPLSAQVRATPEWTFRETLLAAHNGARIKRTAEPLVWSEKLSAEAQTYADELAREAKFVHASPEKRGGAGENLWRGTEGRFQISDMMKAFLDEEIHFKPGQFPDNSLTGNWAQVGHFTQIIWPSTQQVGCAISSGEGDDYLVCRYWPAGNRVGVMLR